MYFFYILIFTTFGYLLTDIFLPSLPILVRYFNVNESLVQTTMFTYTLGYTFSPLFFGPISDIIGRKKIVIAGLLGSLFASFICLFSINIYHMIAGRFIQGIAMGAVMMAGRTLLTDIFKGKALAKCMSDINMLFPLILALAPLLGGAIQEMYNWQAIYIFIIIYTTIILCSLYWMPETVKFNDEKTKFCKRTVLKNSYYVYSQLLRNKKFLLYSFITVLYFINIYSHLTISAFVFQDIFLFTPVEYGKLSIYIGIAIVLFSYINGKIVNYFELNSLIYFGILISFLSGVFLIICVILEEANAFNTYLSMLLFFIAEPFCLANASTLAFQQLSKDLGTANALFATMQFIGGCFGTIIFALIPSQISILGFALCLAFTSFLMFVLQFYVQKIQPQNN